jgi:hypothetical protein
MQFPFDRSLRVLHSELFVRWPRPLADLIFIAGASFRVFRAFADIACGLDRSLQVLHSNLAVLPMPLQGLIVHRRRIIRP